ncbi:uncharacterized protein LOC127842275 isoform X2 [Dreissena polymorpha]|uniref:uncharacterized protein LOC127842275 isoform X2 n=1 Tax=Dreissena polymorpha TaxID=45954 RepID=UPI0022645FA7|nr:uncharacterized protein LOC127842275 isoform X2 [Dreissena polymorpha]
MASLSDVFTESERTNWLKAWLAIDIAKSGLERFVDNAATILHGNIYNAVLSSGSVACNGCHIANLLKCPSPRICNKRGPQGLCISMHDTAFKQPRQCPANVCDKVFVEIAKQHRYSDPSWKNTLANDWASSPWQIAKAYFPPDGYAGNRSAQDTDLNGIISFMMNCKHFNNTFSFPIAPGKSHPPCLLTKTREIGRIVRHSSTCKISDTDLQDMFITLTGLLTDPICLVNDSAAQEAVTKLVQLQTDVLKLTTEEIVELLEAAQNVLKKVETITETAVDEIKIYMENCRKDMATFKQELSKHTGKCIQEFDENRRKFTESNYDQSCKDFQRRLMTHYSDTSSNVPLSNLDQSLDKRITDIYSTPNIHRIEIKKDGKRVKREQALEYKHIFYTGVKSNRRIYVQGEPGSGKSTFSAKLVHDWSHGIQLSSATSSETTAFNDVSTLQKFKFLFFITLRDSRGQTDVTEMIKKQLIDTTFSVDERANVYKCFVQIINTETCLVIREGLDEWLSPDGSNLAEPYMAGFRNETCTILTTSRPWKLTDERIKNSQIDSLLEIEGIVDPYEFSKNILQCIIDQEDMDIKVTADEFESFVFDRKLESLSASPMLYTLVICTWVNTIKKKEHLNNSSLCGLYTTLLESLCKKANSTTGYFNDSNPPPVHCFSSTSYLQPNIEHLDKLAKVACKLLFSSERESSIVFTDITLSNYFSPSEFTVSKTFALTAGILTSRKDKSRTGSSNSFVHKTVQELLAAYHIACNVYTIDDVISSYLKLNNTSYLELSQVCRFLCGMNISAANKLSALMDQYHVIHCNECDSVFSFDWNFNGPCTFQRIIESGIREAVANKQEGIQLKLSHFFIDKSNIRELQDIWPTNTCNVHVVYVNMVMSDSLSSPACGESTSHFELSSCHSLRRLFLYGSGILLRDTASSVATGFPVSITLNNAYPAKGLDTPLELPLIEHIWLDHVKCYSTCLRNLFSTLLTLNHWVTCCLLYCDITSCVEGSDVCTYALKTTISFDELNEFYMEYLVNDSPGLWDALHGLNIKSLSLGYEEQYDTLDLNHTELFSQFLSSLTNLEKLSIAMGCDFAIVCKALHGMNINDLNLRLSYKCDLTANYSELLSQFLSSLIQLERLSIHVQVRPGVWEAFRGLNIKSLSLSLGYRQGDWTVNHAESLLESLSSLTQLKTLSISVHGDIPDLSTVLRGLYIKSLHLDLQEDTTWEGFTVDRGESSSKTLDFTVDGDNPDLLGAVCGLNIKSLCLRLRHRESGLKVDHVESSLQYLISLKHLETLSICVDTDIPSLWNALRGLNAKSLSLTVDCREINHIELLWQSLSSLTQLETLSFITCWKESFSTCWKENTPGLWKALRGLNIKSLSVDGRYADWIVDHGESLSESLSSLTQLETLSISVRGGNRYLFEALCGLNIKTLSLRISYCVDHVESSPQYRLSLKQLDTLDINVDYNSSIVWNALRGLNVKSLKLSSMWSEGLRVKHDESFSQFLSSLTHLKTLRIAWDRSVRWENLCGLNINNLILEVSKDLGEDHVEFLSQFLSSLTQLETLSISVYEDSPGLWEALRDLNITSLSLSGGWSGGLRVNHVESLSQSLSSLRQLETLSICVSEQRPGLWGAFCGLNIKILSLSGIYKVKNVELLSNSLSSLTQLKTLSIIVEKDSPGLWEALSGLNIKSLSVSDKLNGLRVNN